MVEPSQYASTTKYIVKAKFDVQGVVEKPDVVGAVFGQTEGLFGPDLDLRELQKSGRIGRIEINLDSKHDKTAGSIVIPSSLDKLLDFTYVDAFVDTACPSLALDDPERFPKPIVTRDEIMVVMGAWTWEQLLERGLVRL